MIPKGVLEEIDKVCRHYLWSGNQERNKPAMVCWDNVCQPKQSGGLGLKDIYLWNIAAIGKHVWHLALKKDILWVKWVAEVYLKGDEFWTHQPPTNGSWYWRRIIAVRDRLRQGFSGTIWLSSCNGRYTIASGYKWLQGDRPHYNQWKVVWRSGAIPRHAFFLWLVSQERLYTFDRLQKWSTLEVTDKCLLCECASETHQHLFFDCGYSRELLEFGLPMAANTTHAQKMECVVALGHSCGSKEHMAS